MSLRQIGDRYLKGRISATEFLRLTEIQLQTLFMKAFADVWGRVPTDLEQFEIIQAIEEQITTTVDVQTGKAWGLTERIQSVNSRAISSAEFLASLDSYQSSPLPFRWRQSVAKAKAGGSVYAIRRLGVAEHCEQCPGYEVLTPTLIDLIVPPGNLCDCRGRCKCELEFI